MHTESFLQAHRSLVIGAAAVVPLVACAALSLVRDSVANTNAALVLVLIVVAVGATGNRAAGLVAALSSAAWFDFFLTAPFNTFAITDQADIETAVLLVLVGLAVTEIALWGRRQQAGASRQSGYLEGVLGAARAVAEGEVPASAVAEVVAQTSLHDDARLDIQRSRIGVQGGLDRRRRVSL